MFSDPPDGFVPAATACERLGISDRTLRRRVQAGTIEGEYIPRPQGSVLYVRLPEPGTPQAAPDAAQAAPAASTGVPDAAGHAALLTALLERLDSKDAALLAATERAARAEAERDAARQAAEAAQAERDAERAEVRRLLERMARPWWRTLWEW